MCTCVLHELFFFKQKTAYEMRISGWSSDVCSSDLETSPHMETIREERHAPRLSSDQGADDRRHVVRDAFHLGQRGRHDDARHRSDVASGMDRDRKSVV